MSNINQYNIVKNAYDLEVALRDAINERFRLSSEIFKAKPQPPILQVVKRAYPPPK